MCAHNERFAVFPLSITYGPPSIHIPDFVYRNIPQSFFYKQASHKLGALLLVKGRRGNLLDFNRSFDDTFCNVLHGHQSLILQFSMILLRLRVFGLHSVSLLNSESYACLTISRNTCRRASAKPGITSVG